MKRKLLSLFICSVMLAGVVSGCGTDKSTANTLPSSPTVEKTTEIEAIQTDETEFGTYPKLDFDFHKAIENINIFEHKISLPCKLKEFGENFTLNEEILVPVEGSNDLLIPLLYNEKTIAMIILRDCDENDTNKQEKTVVFLGFGDGFNNPITDPNWHDIIDVEISGISFQTSYEEMIEILGKPTNTIEISENSNKYYYKQTDDNYLYIKITDDKIVDITISMEGEKNE